MCLKGLNTTSWSLGGELPHGEKNQSTWFLKTTDSGKTFIEVNGSLASVNPSGFGLYFVLNQQGLP